MEATGDTRVKQQNWWKSLAHYQEPVRWRGIWQALNSIGPYLVTWFLMYLSLDISYWLTLALAIPAAGFLIRSFIIQHDCGHGSFFKSPKANNALGSFIGLLTFIPYLYWRHDHAIHHATAGDLDRRTVGDIWTLTVKEYLELSFWKRMAYRLYRNPLIMFGIGSIYIFLIDYRFPRRGSAWRERKSVTLTNLAIIGLIVILIFTIGWKAYLMVQFPITMVASSAGVWLFYVQHQYEDVYWERHDSWDYEAVALQGSSFYKLPKVLQWFTGNIGFHHVHHLLPRIPNYSLERCHYENAVFFF
ncbi:fatty acid desaturase, partial [bacterium]|nr:fatty acid desaturase [bacterium]